MSSVYLRLNDCCSMLKNRKFPVPSVVEFILNIGLGIFHEF